MTTISVLLVDDQTLIRAALRGLLESEPDLTIVGECGDGADGAAAARALRPDVVLMDIRMPGVDGIEATRLICADPDLAATRVLVLTTFEEDDLVAAALRAGASGFLGKGMDPAALSEAIRVVHGGDALPSPAATRSLIDRVVHATNAPAPDRPTHPGLAELTGREREVLILVASGLSNDEIGHSLFISPATAKTHVNRTMAKLWAHDRAQLVIIAYENGLVVPGAR